MSPGWVEVRLETTNPFCTAVCDPDDTIAAWVRRGTVTRVEGGSCAVACA